MTREELHEIRQYVINEAPEGLSYIYLKRVISSLEAAWDELETAHRCNSDLLDDLIAKRKECNELLQKRERIIEILRAL